MGAQERRLLGVTSGDAKAALFVTGSQPVARFALEGRRPGPQGFGHQTGHGGVQLLVTGRPGGRHGAEDASRLVGAARQTGGELCAPVAGKNEVGVAVHEPGHNRPAGEVEIGCRQLPLGTLPASPTHAMRPSTATRALAARHPSGPSPMVGSLVTSSPMWSKTTEFPSAGGLTESSRRAHGHGGAH